MNKKMSINIGLLLVAALIAIIPLLTVKDSEFGGADGRASEVVEEMNEDFEPWFQPLWEPPGGETESLLFAFQAALGSGVIFFCIGYLKGRNESRRESPNPGTGQA